MSRTYEDLKPMESTYLQSMRDPALLHLLNFFARNSYTYVALRTMEFCMETAAVCRLTMQNKFAPLGFRAYASYPVALPMLVITARKHMPTERFVPTRWKGTSRYQIKYICGACFPRLAHINYNKGKAPCRLAVADRYVRIHISILDQRWHGALRRRGDHFIGRLGLLEASKFLGVFRCKGTSRSEDGASTYVPTVTDGGQGCP